MEIQNNDTIINKNISPQPSSNPKAKYLIGILLSFLLGILLISLIDKNLPPSFSNYKKGNAEGHTAGFNSAKSIVEKSTVGGFFKSPNEIKKTSGTITSIKGNILTIHSQEINNPFDGQSINDRNVTVATSTKIFEIKNKTVEAYQKEIADFMKKKYPPEVAKNLYPTQYSRTSIEISTLKVGDRVGVISTENIKNVKNFTAVEIQLEPSMIITSTSTVKK